MLSSSLGDVRAMVKQKYLRGPQREVRAIAPGANTDGLRKIIYGL